MLQALRVLNFGVVDDVLIDFPDGLTVLTGETGAGKTLLIEALHLVLGGKDRSLPVRDESVPSRVEAVFDTDAGAEVLLVRERTAHGRLRASIDGATASAQLLAERAGPLCQLHGQHEHQVLRAPGAARALLDRSASIDDTEVRELRAAVRRLRARRDELGGSAAERARQLELLSYECDEIDAAAIEAPNEIEALLEEVGTLAAVLESKEALARAAVALDGDGEPASATSLLEVALGSIPRAMDDLYDQTATLLDGVRSTAAQLRRDLEGVEDDPDRLGALNDRVALLQALVRKHGTSLSDVLSRRVALGRALEALRDDEALSLVVEAELDEISTRLEVASSEVRAARSAAAVDLAAAVLERLGPLALPHARFEVAVEGEAGEQVTFLFAGGDVFSLAPLAEAASGGELSRVMLALTLAARSGAATMVFDEVDAGVGGATARSLAACLAEVASTRQVVVITHLATIASVAAHHVVVTKGADAGEPASVRQVTGHDREREIARMLAGDPDDPVALAHAATLLRGDPVSP